jgi:hypothetical protein
MPILITAKVAGFRRCGIAHSDQTTTYPDDQFSAAQLRELQADPMLVVSVVSDDVPPPSTDIQAQFVESRADVERLTTELKTVTAERDALQIEAAHLTTTLETVTAEYDALKQAQAAASKDTKKAVKTES